MRNIIRNREIVSDGWRYPGTDGEGPQVATLARCDLRMFIPMRFL